MTSVSIEEAQERLPELLHQLNPGDELTITEDDRPLAKIVAAKHARSERRLSGVLKGSVRFMADDFDAPLDDFKDYMK
ncbi:MAG: DUF2281 domain-containing protein [Planctomycetota bacterium]|nr:DUF2281 domain-containing protein [Planctomycetota bacterium]MDA1142697.1 DUF2281 domain-containing protein [Planctomycetota bacterium]